ncbi:DUF4012 domain-containing protein [Acidimicrobiales bacterium]|nr:DUF4012 domain-containing protein [Acidimicrobiales bacterium]
MPEAIDDAVAVLPDNPVPGPGHNQTRAGQRPQLVAAVALAAAVAAAFSDGAPTGLTAWDIVLKGLVAALFVFAAASSPDWAVILVATVAAVFVGASAWLGPVVLGLVLATGTGVLRPRRPWMSVVAAGLVIQGLFRIPDIGFFGAPSLIAGAAIMVMLAFGYRGSSAARRQIIRQSTGATIAISVILCSIGGLTLLRAKADVDLGITAARSGLSAARGGDPVAVVAELEAAADSLGAAQDRVTGVLAQPLRLIPIVAQHRHAVVVATTQGRDIARQASRTTIEADISSVSMNSGSVDLSVLSSMEADLVNTAELLETGVAELDAARSDWLISQISSRMQELTDEMRDILPEARVAADAARVLPGMLGQDGPRRYFIGFGSPVESRELGGFVGSWALLEFDAGQIRQIDAGRIAGLYDLARSQEPLSRDDYPRWYVDRARPHRWPQNITGSPDLATVAAGSRDVFEGIAGGSIDGFVYLDAYALSALLKLTGPLRIDGVDHPINAGNVVEFLFDEQFRLDNRQTLKSQQSEIFAQAFDDLLDSQLPGPERLGDVLGPVARQGRLQVATFDTDENAFLRSIKLQREFGWLADERETADSFAVVQTNGLRNKLDLYLHREITYDATVDEAGRLVVSGTIELLSEVPDDAPEYTLGGDLPGTNWVYLSLFTPHRVSMLSLDGEPFDQGFTREFGYDRNEIPVGLSPNVSRSIEFELIGQVDPTQPYDVSVWHQPLVNNDIVHLSYTGADGVTLSEQLDLAETIVVSFED